MQQEHCAGVGHLKFGKGNLMGTFTRGGDLKKGHTMGTGEGHRTDRCGRDMEQ